MQAPPALIALVISGMVRRFSSRILRRMYGSVSEKHLQTMRPSSVLLVVDVDAQAFQIDAAPLGPVEHGRLQGLGPHHRAVDLLLRQPFQEVDDVLLRIFRASMGV